jgi:hypothetical protein
MQRLRRHLTYANIAATLALIIAIAGGTTAIAGSKIGAQDLKRIKVRTSTATATAGRPIPIARCRAGEKLTGGGGEGIEGASNPSGNGWAVTGPVAGTAKAYALCLSR